VADHITAQVLQRVIESEQERMTRIDRAWRAYLGTAEKPLVVGPEGDDDNVRINLARAIVNKSTSWLLGADRALGFASEDDKGLKARLDELWPVERRAGQLHQIAVNGGVTGHTFARLMADGRVVVWDPGNVDVEWDQDDVERVLRFTNTWPAYDREKDEPYARRQRVERTSEVEADGEDEDAARWEIIDERSTTAGDTWDELGRVTWDFEWCPVFHCQNLPAPNEFYGLADLEMDVLDLIEAIEAVAGYARKLIRHRGHPLPYVIGEKKVEQINVSLGRLLKIPNVEAKVGQLEAGDLGGALSLYEALREAFHETTRCPAIAFGKSANMTNVAADTVELAYSSAVELTWDKRLTYGPMLSELAGRVLELDGKTERRPTPQWGEIIPRSEQSTATILETDRRMKIVSKETVAERRGYDWKVEKDRLDAEAEEGAEQFERAFNRPPGTGGEPGGEDPPADA
jgi:hypothetical protein